MALRVVEKGGDAGGDLGYARKMSRERRPAPEEKGSGRAPGGCRRVDDPRKKRRLSPLGFVVVAGVSTATEMEEGEVVEELDDGVEAGELVEELGLDGRRPAITSIAAPVSSRHAPSWGTGEGEVQIERRLEAALGRFRKQVQAGPIGAGKLGALFGGYGTFLLPSSERKGGCFHAGRTQRQRKAQLPRRPPRSGQAVAEANSSDDPPRAAVAAARLALPRCQKSASPEKRPPASSKGGALLITAASGALPSAHCSPIYTGASTSSGGRGDVGFERRLEAVFGDCWRWFEGGGVQINARKLGPMFGGYGTFLLAV